MLLEVSEEVSDDGRTRMETTEDWDGISEPEKVENYFMQEIPFTETTNMMRARLNGWSKGSTNSSRRASSSIGFRRIGWSLLKLDGAASNFNRISPVNQVVRIAKRHHPSERDTNGVGIGVTSFRKNRKGSLGLASNECPANLGDDLGTFIMRHGLSNVPLSTCESPSIPFKTSHPPLSKHNEKKQDLFSCTDFGLLHVPDTEQPAKY